MADREAQDRGVGLEASRLLRWVLILFRMQDKKSGSVSEFFGDEEKDRRALVVESKLLRTKECSRSQLWSRDTRTSRELNPSRV